MSKANKRVEKSKLKLLEYIENLPKLQFTSGDITGFINGRKTYIEAWDQIKREGTVKRTTVPRGTATGWKRAKFID